jgi:hypothetical protein
MSAQGLYKTKVLKPMLNSLEDLIPCCYRNETNIVQILRISKPIPAYFERAVMPGQVIYFKAPHDSALEIYEAMMFESVRTDTLPCAQLRCGEAIGKDILKKDVVAVRTHSLSRAA